MQQMQEPPQGVGAIRSRRRPPRRRTSATLPQAWTAEDLEAILASHQQAMGAQIERGVRALHQTAARLMSQLAQGAEEGISAEDTERALLTHVDERYGALNLRMERLEGALRRLVQTFKKDLTMGAGEAAPVAGRLESMARAIDRLAAQQRHDLQAFTDQTGRGLARIAARTGEELGRVAQRQEAVLDRKLDEMREAIEGLGNGSAGPGPRAPTGSAGADGVGSVFLERLQAAERRLATATEQVGRWDPFVGTAEDEGRNPA